jgi:tetratricopeptide (TPR) repeat protein
VVLEMVRRSFLLQIELAANLLFFTLHGLFTGLLATSLVVVLLHGAELRHIWQERLARRLGPASARVWAWAILLAPFAAGMGIALPTLAFLGMLWPLLRVRERVLFAALLVAVVAAPFAGHVLGRLAAPLREEQGPLYGVAALPDEAWTPTRQAGLQRLADEHPDNPFVQFGLGWVARQGRDLATAETAYRRALALWPQDARVMNNLANVLVAEGRLPPAIDLYRAAMSVDPENAAAPFNLSLVYTRQFEYRAASEAAARASALDFELVKGQQALGTEDGVLPMADQWMAPATLWSTILAPAGKAPPVLPPAWRGRLETSGPAFAGLALLLAIGGVLVGARWQSAIPLRPCRNCGRVVCRRCSQRRRELALCPACADQEGQAESPEFARMLLARLRGRRERRQRVVRTAFAALLPGVGLLAYHRVFRATVLIATTVLLTGPWLGLRAPFSFHSWPGLGEGTVPGLVSLAIWIAVYGNSLLGYHAQDARAAAEAAAAAAPVRSRPTSAGRITAKAA